MAPKKKPAATTSAPDNQAPSESQAAQSIPVDVEPPTGRKRAPPFEWKDNDYEKVWELIKEMGVKTNFTILFGKKQDEDAENKTEDEVGAEKRGSKKKGKNKDQTNVVSATSLERYCNLLRRAFHISEGRRGEETGCVSGHSPEDFCRGVQDKQGCSS